jgi:chromosome segregation ATPase
MATRTVRGSKNVKVEQVEAKTVLAAVKELDPAKVVTDVGNLQLSVQSTLSNLSASITNKMAQVNTIDDAIRLKEERLQELYGIEKEAVTLDDMKAQVEAERAQAEIEREERDARWSEETAERQKQSKRALEDWSYEFEQKKKRLQEEFDAEVARNRRGEQVRAEALVKQWEEREAALKMREQEMADLKKMVEGFDARLKAEIAKAEAVVGNTMKRQHEYETALLKKDSDAALKLSEAQIGSLNSSIANLNKQVVELNAQLVSARNDAKDIASSALQSSSQKQVADALSRVLEQRDTPVTKK